jgi:hypothetical protein
MEPAIQSIVPYCHAARFGAATDTAGSSVLIKRYNRRFTALYSVSVVYSWRVLVTEYAPLWKLNAAMLIMPLVEISSLIKGRDLIQRLSLEARETTSPIVSKKF